MITDQEYLTWCIENEFYDPQLFGLRSFYIDVRTAVLNYYAKLEEQCDNT